MTFSVPESATVPFVHIVASLRPFRNPNTPDDKHEFRVRPTDHLFLGSIPPGGTKRFDGAVDGDYWVTLSADGYLGTSTWVDRTTTSPMTLRSAKGEKDAILVQVNAPAATVTATKTPAAPSRATVVNPPSDQRENVILAQIDNIRLLHSDQLAAALEKRLDAERAELATTVTSSPNGRVIVGRVVVVGGAIDPREVKAQMPIYEDGWFVEAISDAGKPVEFRLEGYKPVDVMVGNVGKRGSLVWIGTVGMAPLTNSGSKEQRPAASPAPTPAPAAGKIETASVEREISWLRENLEPALNFSDQSYASDDWEVPSSLIYKNRIRPNGTCWIRFDGHVSFAPSVSDSLSRQGEGKEKDCTINLARIPLVTVQSAVPHFTASDLEWRTPRHKALVVGDCVVDVDPRKEQIIPKASAALDRMAALCRGEAVSGTRWWAAP